MSGPFLPWQAPVLPNPAIPQQPGSPVLRSASGAIGAVEKLQKVNTITHIIFLDFPGPG